jgi:hypothetical protein
MMAKMLVQCPTCGNSFDLAARERPGGTTGGSFCPHCHERFAIPGPTKAVAIASLIIALGILALVGVRSIIGFVSGSALLWIPISLFLNGAAVRRKGVVLRKWKTRRRTFFEWLYERESTPELFDKKPR